MCCEAGELSGRQIRLYRPVCERIVGSAGLSSKCEILENFLECIAEEDGCEHKGLAVSLPIPLGRIWVYGYTLGLLRAPPGASGSPRAPAIKWP